VDGSTSLAMVFHSYAMVFHSYSRVGTKQQTIGGINTTKEKNLVYYNVVGRFDNPRFLMHPKTIVGYLVIVLPPSLFLFYPDVEWKHLKSLKLTITIIRNIFLISL
jgi:hypothetical protein